MQDGSVPEPADHDQARQNVGIITDSISDLRPHLPHDRDYLELLVKDFRRWASEGFVVPDFLDSLVAFHPEQWRIDGLPHLVVFPMYTQNGSTNRYFEAVLIEVIWPSFVAELEAENYSNKLFVPISFVDSPLAMTRTPQFSSRERVGPEHPLLHLGRHFRGPRSCPVPSRPKSCCRHHFPGPAG